MTTLVALIATLFIGYLFGSLILEIVVELPRAGDRREVLRLRAELAARAAEQWATEVDLGHALRETHRLTAERDLVLDDLRNTTRGARP